jgi:hypothetical protein
VDSNSTQNCRQEEHISREGGGGQDRGCGNFFTAQTGRRPRGTGLTNKPSGPPCCSAVFQVGSTIDRSNAENRDAGCVSIYTGASR